MRDFPTPPVAMLEHIGIPAPALRSDPASEERASMDAARRKMLSDGLIAGLIGYFAVAFFFAVWN
ncbi:MAG: hypothetical protein ACOCVZ_09775, partial [Gemmatimonadota bacterium]